MKLKEYEAKLVEHHSKVIYQMLINHTGDPQLARDLVQDAFVVAIVKLRAGQVRNPQAIRAFLCQTARNLLMAHNRRERRYLYQEHETLALHATQPDQSAEGIDHVFITKLLDKAMNRLSRERDRNLLNRFYLMDEDKVRICSDLQLSSAHFDRVINRARQRLRLLLTGETGLDSLSVGGSQGQSALNHTCPAGGINRESACA